MKSTQIRTLAEFREWTADLPDETTIRFDGDPNKDQGIRLSKISLIEVLFVAPGEDVSE